MFKILGINDDVTTCECCGKTNLKATVVMESENIGIVHYGRDCAAKKLTGGNKSGAVKTIESTARGINYCREWLRKTPAHTASIVAAACRSRFCPAYDVGGAIHFVGGTVVE